MSSTLSRVVVRPPLVAMEVATEITPFERGVINALLIAAVVVAAFLDVPNGDVMAGRWLALFATAVPCIALGVTVVAAVRGATDGMLYVGLSALALTYVYPIVGHYFMGFI